MNLSIVIYILQAALIDLAHPCLHALPDNVCTFPRQGMVFDWSSTGPSISKHSGVDSIHDVIQRTRHIPGVLCCQVVGFLPEKMKVGFEQQGRRLALSLGYCFRKTRRYTLDGVATFRLKTNPP